MATPEPPSPSAIAFPGMVRSPSKEQNAHGHPYPIKTTSTAILSRSNSITSRSQVPLVYTPSPSPNAKPLGRSQSRGHGRSGSLSNITPPLPLPLPTKRRDSQGSVQQDIPPTPDPEAIAQLPDNPKEWTPSQLSVYLSSALRFKGGGSIPARVAKDIAGFALREKLTGRAFLRLTDENLTAMGVNQLWREALLSASRTLRKKVLKGRIWGFGSEFQDQTPVKPAKRRIPSTVEEEQAAALSQTLSLSSSSPPTSGGYRGGRVRGMIESLERSHSSTASGGSDEDFENSTLTNERLESELKAAGLWINDEVDGEDDAGNISSASSSSDIEDHHSRNSSGSQPPAYTRTAPLDVSDEPSMEDLLAQSTPAKAHSRQEGTFEEAPSWGAMVWEKDTDIVGGTAKKIIPLDAPRPLKPGVISGEAQPTILNIFGDATDNNQEPPAPEINAHELLDAFRVRLEKMEQRLKELELRDEEREKEMTNLRENEKKRIEEEEKRKQEEERKMVIDLSPHPDPYATIVDTDDDEPVDIPWPRPVRETFTPGAALTPLAIPGQKGPESMDKDKKKTAESHQEDDAVVPKDNTADLIPSELPGYVLFVGLGVCVVVARVLFRRMGGARRG